jgi:hypothetical protein
MEPKSLLDYFPQDENANDVFAPLNCFQNVEYGSDNWEYSYCIGKTLEWIGYFILSVLFSFLLALHCIMYTKINKRWSFKIFSRNRVQILSLSLLMTSLLFLKLTFMM